MGTKPEGKAREQIDGLLRAAGWQVEDMGQHNLGAAPGVVVREFPLATGSGKTYMAVAAAYRLVKFARVRRVLFLVDRSNPGRQSQVRGQVGEAGSGRFG